MYEAPQVYTTPESKTINAVLETVDFDQFVWMIVPVLHMQEACMFPVTFNVWMAKCK